MVAGTDCLPLPTRVCRTEKLMVDVFQTSVAGRLVSAVGSVVQVGRC